MSVRLQRKFKKKRIRKKFIFNPVKQPDRHKKGIWCEARTLLLCLYRNVYIVSFHDSHFNVLIFINSFRCSIWKKSQSQRDIENNIWSNI